jgi:type IV pilus assembly protein PilV
MNSQRGTSLIEVLVTMVILAFGLLGAAGLQARLQLADMEAYQRAQALVLLDDIASRIATNRANAAAYVTTAATPLGTGMVACPIPGSPATLEQTDAVQWCNALKGAAEVAGVSKVGAMLGARGCVEILGAAANKEYLITVAWQGLAPVSAPPASIACGANLYDGAAGSTSSNCAADRCRRVVTTVVRIGGLT